MYIEKENKITTKKKLIFLTFYPYLLSQFRINSNITIIYQTHKFTPHTHNNNK